MTIQTPFAPIAGAIVSLYRTDRATTKDEKNREKHRTGHWGCIPCSFLLSMIALLAISPPAFGQDFIDCGKAGVSRIWTGERHIRVYFPDGSSATKPVSDVDTSNILSSALTALATGAQVQVRIATTGANAGQDVCAAGYGGGMRGFFIAN